MDFVCYLGKKLFFSPESKTENSVAQEKTIHFLKKYSAFVLSDGTHFGRYVGPRKGGKPLGGYLTFLWYLRRILYFKTDDCSI